MSAEPGPVRLRRRPAELQKLLVEAAEKVFREKGFVDATIDDIVQEAGVSKSVFYRNFKTKDALFSAAVLEPFTRILEDFRPRYSASFAGPFNEERLLDLEKDLLRQIEKHLRANRGALERLSASDPGLDARSASLLRRRFGGIFEEMRSWGEAESAVWSSPPDLELTDRLIVCMIAGVVMFDDWFLPSGRNKLTREALIDHMARLLLYGVRLGGDSTKAPAPKPARNGSASR